MSGRKFKHKPFKQLRKMLAGQTGHDSQSDTEEIGTAKAKKNMLALELEPLIAQKAKENQAHGKTAPGKTLLQKSAEALDTRSEIAKAAGVSHDTIAKVKAIISRKTTSRYEWHDVNTLFKRSRQGK